MASYANAVDIQQLVKEGEVRTDGEEKAEWQAELARLTKLYVDAVEQLQGARLARELLHEAENRHSDAQEHTYVTGAALSMALDLASSANKALDIEDLLATTDDPRDSLKGNKLPVNERIPSAKRMKNTQPS